MKMFNTDPDFISWGDSQRAIKHTIYFVFVVSMNHITYVDKEVMLCGKYDSWTWSTFFKSRTRADCRLAPSQWEMSLQSNAISHCIGANLEISPEDYVQAQW